MLHLMSRDKNNIYIMVNSHQKFNFLMAVFVIFSHFFVIKESFCGFLGNFKDFVRKML